jgi:hypothetical protein
MSSARIAKTKANKYPKKLQKENEEKQTFCKVNKSNVFVTKIK